MGRRATKAEKRKKGDPTRKRSQDVLTRKSQLVREEGANQRKNAKLRCCQTEKGGNACWDAEHLDHDLPSSMHASIASQPLGPGKARACPLRSGEDRVHGERRSDGKR